MPKAPKWEEEFRRACRKNDVGALKRALAMGLPIHEPIKAYKGISALCSAVIQGAKPEVLQALIDAGADVNSPADAGKSALAAAAETGRPDQIKLLIAAGADWTVTDALGFTPLTLACLDKTAGHEQSLRELLAAGAKPTVDNLDLACSNGDPLGPDEKLGSPAMIRMLIEAAVDVNGFSKWGTALHRAASNGNVEVARVLLELGADLKLRIPADEEDCGNMTPLEVAQEFEKKKMIAFLKAAASGQTPPKPAKRRPVTAKMPQLWKRLESALADAAPQVKKSLRRGAGEANLAKFEKLSGLKLPADFRAIYLLHDGQTDDGDGLFPTGLGDLNCDYLLMPLAEVIGDWQMWQELIESGDFEDEDVRPDDGVRGDWWNVGWVPFATNGAGDLLCLDLKPAKGGAVGQVIRMSHESGERPRLADSLRDLVDQLCEHFEELAEEKE